MGSGGEVSETRDQRFEVRLTQSERDAVDAAARSEGVTAGDVVRRRILPAFTRPRVVYALDASGATPSLIRDQWHVMNESYLGDSTDARDRLKQHDGFMRELRQQFTTVTTGNAGQVIPPGYEPLLASSVSDRPLYAAATKGDLSDATPFTLPGNLSEASIDSGSAAGVAEGTNATDGSMAFSGGTVTPVGIRGRFVVTRELVDASNPAIDAVAFGAMREDWDRQAETLIFTELNTVQAGTITSGLVPSGAQARTSAGTALPQDLAKAILNFADVRKTKARSVVASTRSTVSDALEAVDLTRLAFRDVSIEQSPWITGTAAGDGDCFVLGEGDLYAWSSPLLDFRYVEKNGPATVELAIWGYYATKLIKPAGLASIRHT